MGAAGVEDINALASAIERSDRRREIEKNMATAESALMQAADGLPVDALREEIAGVGPDELKARLDEFGMFPPATYSTRESLQAFLKVERDRTRDLVRKLGIKPS